MTLEELKAALDKAIADAAAKPEDAALKKAVEDAQAAYDTAKAQAESNPNPDDLDESKLDEKTKQYIAKLRKESASHRTKKKDLESELRSERERKKAILKAAGIESEDEKPEEKVKALSAQNSNMALRNAILESALQHSIPADSIDYYEFLVNKATSELEEGEELEESKLTEIVAKVKKQSSKGPANSSVSGGSGNPPPSDGSNKNITLERFCAMSITEKSKLYETNRDLYTELMTAARSKKKLV